VQLRRLQQRLLAMTEQTAVTASAIGVLAVDLGHSDSQSARHANEVAEQIAAFESAAPQLRMPLAAESVVIALNEIMQLCQFVRERGLVRPSTNERVPVTLKSIPFHEPTLTGHTAVTSETAINFSRWTHRGSMASMAATNTASAVRKAMALPRQSVALEDTTNCPPDEAVASGALVPNDESDASGELAPLETRLAELTAHMIRLHEDSAQAAKQAEVARTSVETLRQIASQRWEEAQGAVAAAERDVSEQQLRWQGELDELGRRLNEKLVEAKRDADERVQAARAASRRVALGSPGEVAKREHHRLQARLHELRDALHRTSAAAAERQHSLVGRWPLTPQTRRL
jgi:hypothetical protein